MAQLPNGEFETEEEARQDRHDTLKAVAGITAEDLYPSATPEEQQIVHKALTGIVQIFPNTDHKGLDAIVEEQKAYYGLNPPQVIIGMGEKLLGANPTHAIVDEVNQINTLLEDGKAYYREPNPIDVTKMIFVFGSNEAGRHGAGAARYAHVHKGAVYNKGHGHHGQSYALPTMDRNIKPLSLDAIRRHVSAFWTYADRHPEFKFQVTQVGCGLGGQRREDIAPMFVDAPSNCYFDTAWKPWLPNAKFWGTF